MVAERIYVCRRWIQSKAASPWRTHEASRCFVKRPTRLRSSTSLFFSFETVIAGSWIRKRSLQFLSAFCNKRGKDRASGWLVAFTLLTSSRHPLPRVDSLFLTSVPTFFLLFVDFFKDGNSNQSLVETRISRIEMNERYRVDFAWTKSHQN